MSKNFLKWGPYVLLLLVGLFLYAGIFKVYAFTDAYDYVYSASQPDFINVFLEGGRPIYGWIIKWSYINFYSLEELSFLRFFSLLLSFSFCFYFYNYLLKEGFNQAASLLLSLLILLSPSMSIKILWSVLWIMPLITLASFYTGVLLLTYYKKKSPIHLIVAIVLGLLVLLTYQPLFTFSIVPVFLYWFKERNQKGIIKIGVVHFFTYALYFAIFKSYLFVYDITPQGRASISLDFIDRVTWFLSGPLLKSFTWNLFFVASGFRWVFRALVFLSVLILFFKTYRSTIKSTIINLLILIAFFFVSYLPNLLSTDNWMSYRTMDALLFLPILFIVCTLTNGLLNRQWSYAVLSLFLIISLFMAHKNINSGFIDLQVAELNAVKKKVASVNDVQEWIIVPAPLKLVREEKILKRVITDEFGRLSTSSKWVPEPMLKLVLRSLGRNEDVKINIKNANEIIPDDPATIEVRSLFLTEMNL